MAALLVWVVLCATLAELGARAFWSLRYGAATRLVLQFRRRFWNKPGRPNAFGSDQAFGAVWDGNEQQRGPHGILSFLAGGTASRELQSILRTGGPEAVAGQIRWLGRPTQVVASRSVTWEDDQWARGGYAYVDPRFNPALRDWLARPAGRVVFAGEHTSVKWQGYINGAILSGHRAAAEIRAAAERCYEKLFGAPIPKGSGRSVSEHARWRH